MKQFITILLSVASLSLFSAGFDPFAGPKPMAVFIQSDPWAMVMGADTPRVAVYEDGTVIYLKKSGNSERYYRKVLSPTELSDLKKQLTPTADLMNLKHFYTLRPGVTDQPEALFYIRAGERELITRVYGLRATGTKLPGYSVLPDDSKRDTLPFRPVFPSAPVWREAFEISQQK